MASLTLNGLNINDQVNYFAFWDEEQPYSIQSELIPSRRWDRPYINNFRQQEKVITVKGLLKDTTTAGLGALIINLKNKLIVDGAPISIVWKDGITYTGKFTCKDLVFDNNHYNITHIAYEATIVVVGLLEGTTLSTKTSTATGTLASTMNANTGGIAYTSMRWTWNTGSSLSKILFTLYDTSASYPDSSKSVSFAVYPSGWATGQYIDIDSKTKTITHSTLGAIDYYGEIFLMPPGSTNGLQITATGTSINFTNKTDFYLTLP